MGFRPRTRREALLYELKARHGYFVNPMSADDLSEMASPHEIAERVLQIEGLDPALDSKNYDEVRRVIEDWMFDPNGRGARSGLPN